jgi:Bifunctional DNA primase/polymerase, N-terminal
MTSPYVLNAALRAARRGWPVFPLRRGTKRPRAELTGWEQRATLDLDRIRRWWGRHPDDNAAIATGPAGLVVVDLDLAQPGESRPADWPAARGGLDVYNALAAEHGGHRRTWTVGTASGGFHLYYRAPEHGGSWRNTAGRIGWHIDTRAAGGYVVAEGSTVGGLLYVALDTSSPAELPDWIAARLAPPPSCPTGSRRGSHPRRHRHDRPRPLPPTRGRATPTRRCAGKSRGCSTPRSVSATPRSTGPPGISPATSPPGSSPAPTSRTPSRPPGTRRGDRPPAG